MRYDVKQIALEACVLVAFGALFGMTLHYRLIIDAFSGQLVAKPPVQEQSGASLALPRPVLIEEVQQVRAAGGLIVDARSPELYAAGAIEGAVSLPMVDIEAVLPEFLSRFGKDTLIVTYCSGFGCPDSFDLGVRLIAAGYRDVRIFEGGYPEWRDAGLPTSRGGQ